MNRNLKKSALALMCAAAAVVGGRMAYVETAQRTDLFDSSIQAEVIRDGELTKIDVPVYGPHKVPANNCSGYARRAAEDIFDKKYSFANAWDRVYSERIVAMTDEKIIMNQIEEGILEPGMIVGVYYPRSKHLGQEDIQGNPITFTHNMLFLGVDGERRGTFAELFGSETRLRTLEQFAEHDLKPVVIFDSK